MSHKSSASTHQCSFLQRLFTARRKRRRDTRRTLLLEQVEARTLFNADFGVAHNSPLLADPAEVASSEVQACVVTSELIQQATSTILENSGAWTPQISSAWFGFVVPSEPREVSVGKISAGPSLATIQWQGKSTKVIERDWIIQFSQEKAAHVRSLADVSATLDSIGLRAERVRGLGMKGLVSVTLSSGIDAGQVVAALNDDARVSFFEPATIVESLALPDDPRFADQTQDYQTAAFSLGVPAAWDITTGSQDVVIGLLDTGFDFEHVDLRDNAWDGTADGNIIHGKDFVNSDDSPQDDNGHGTHVAGIIGA